jgi:SpoIID/LytB domain protein
MPATRFDIRRRTGHRGTPSRQPTGTGPNRSGARIARGLLAVLVVASALVTVDLHRGAGPVAASGDGDPTVVITGRGWGHGRGMGQYGALGYARDFGWSADRILDHFYRGTTGGPAPAGGPVDGSRVRVDLVTMRSQPTTVALASGTLHLMDEAGTTLARLTGAVRLTAFDDQMGVLTAPGCDGPWTAAPALDAPLVRVAAETTGAGTDGLLEVCSATRSTWYAGEVWATTTTIGGGGLQRTVNLVTIEEYLRGVIPNEVPASWPAAALEAQAVAARSYAMAGDTRWTTWADTCDSTLCQVYDGRFTTRSGFRRSTDPRTDAAVDATAGRVRLRGNGTVARTEFSSSTGGWTAGGDFPAVVDEGDAVLANPNARWQTTVRLASIEASYGRGPLVGIGVVERNGHGADGGRVERVELRFRDGSVMLGGDTVRRRFGLKSNWFSIGNLTRNGVVQEPIDGQLIARFVDRAYRRIVGRPPTADEARRGAEVVRAGSRHDLADRLVRSDGFAGTLVDDLYRRALGREADADGRSYWVRTMADGLKYELVGTLFYGSPEFVKLSGGTDEAFVEALYHNILGRGSDAAGRRYWLDQLASGRARPDDVANAFYRSIESRRDRSRALHQVVLGAPAGASMADRLAARLLSADDLTVAAELAVDLDLEDP